MYTKTNEWAALNSILKVTNKNSISLSKCKEEETKLITAELF